jgi:lipoate-protein ligase A
LEAALADWVAAGGGTLDRDGAWTDDELARARELVETRYCDDEWVRQRPGT